MSRVIACVLVHHETKRPMCFCMDTPNDPLVAAAEANGFEKIEITSANEYDRWAKKLRDQAQAQSEMEDYKYLEIESKRRKQLRDELRSRLARLESGAQRHAVESALHVCDVLEAKRERIRETFFVQEGYEESNKTAGEEIVSKIITNQ